MQKISLTLVAALGMLVIPYVVMGVWVAHVEGWQSLAAFVATSELMLLLIAFAVGTWRRLLCWCFPLFLLSVAFTAYTVSYHTLPGWIIAVILSTSNWEEVRGFFSIWQGQRLLLWIAALSLVYLLLARYSPRQPMSAGRTGPARWAMLGILVLLAAYAGRNPSAFIDGAAANPVIGAILFSTGPLQEARADLKGTSGRKVPFRATRDGAEEVHILVIGESARRDSWSVYGYQRPTTPYLEKIRGETVFFQHAVADANLTTYAVPILLTGVHADKFNFDAITGNLIDLAKEAGYSTAWLMNQDVGVSLLAGVHADWMVYPHMLTGLISGRYDFDGSMLPAFQHEFDKRGHARFIGIHTIGSHWEYYARYPAAFERFGSTQGLSFISALSMKPDPAVVNAYDNSVAYTDWLLGQIIEQARQLTVPASVTYFSDHGEDLYDLDGSAGHGTAVYTPHQFDIPGFIWMNAAYRAAHPDKVLAITRNATRLVRTHNVFYSVADLMGIQWPGASATQSFASDRYTPDLTTPLWVGGKWVPIVP